MAIQRTNEGGKAYIPESTGQNSTFAVAEGVNKTGGWFYRHRKGVAIFIAAAALVEKTAVPFVESTAHFAKDTGGAVAEGTGALVDLLPDFCVGTKCSENGDSKNNSQSQQVEGGKVTGSATTGEVPAAPAALAHESVQIEAGKGVLWVARICLGQASDAVVTPQIQQEANRIQSINTAAIADGLQVGESLIC